MRLSTVATTCSCHDTWRIPQEANCRQNQGSVICMPMPVLGTRHALVEDIKGQQESFGGRQANVYDAWGMQLGYRQVYWLNVSYQQPCLPWQVSSRQHGMKKCELDR